MPSINFPWKETLVSTVLSLLLLLLCNENTGVIGQPSLPHIDLFSKASDGFECYRVPAILSTPKFLFVFAEGRNGVPNATTCERDETCPNKTIVVKRSPDYGQTWSIMQKIVTVACGAPGVECGYENAVFDTSTGSIFLTYVGNPGSFILTSTDLGDSWSNPKNLSALLPSVAKNSAPGHGIEIDATFCSDPSCCPPSRLIIPYECYNNSQNYACVVFSDDHGESWELGAWAQSGSRESEVVQIVGGKNGNSSCANLYSNERNYERTHGGLRYAAWSEDGGRTFDTFAVTPLYDPVTPTWVGVVAGLCRFTGPTGSEPSRILFSHPNNPTQRINMTIHVSYDETTTWNSGKVLDPGPSGYSDLTKLGNGNAAIVYERGNITAYDVITFVVFDASWVDLKN